jgi:DUF4097 and DUF4098 domain-containing protein YvlB
MLRTLCLTATLAASLAAAGLAQSRTQGFGRSADAWCGDDWNDRRASHCEVRDATVAGTGLLDVDAGRNGGIRIRGWDRGDVLVRTKIVGYAGTEAEARRIVSDVRVETAGGRVRADGPDTNRDEHWSASFEIQVPRTAQLELNAHNGGISIDDFRGMARFHGQNGGVSLSNVNGDIRGETANGGVNIDLTGDRWDGVGLDVETRNGGVRMTLPERYSAELETGTINGHVSIDFPVTVQGVIGRRLTTTLGRGGARVRAVTTNGGVTIHRR